MFRRHEIAANTPLSRGRWAGEPRASMPPLAAGKEADDVWLLESGGQTLAFTQSTGDLLITVPEPSTLMLLSGVAVANMIRRRRR